MDDPLPDSAAKARSRSCAEAVFRSSIAAGPIRSLAAIELLNTASAQLRDLALAAESGKGSSTAALARVRDTFEDAVGTVRAERLTASITLDAAARVFGLVFAVESLLANLSDLGDRIAELDGQAAPSAAAGAVAGAEDEEP